MYRRPASQVSQRLGLFDLTEFFFIRSPVLQSKILRSESNENCKVSSAFFGIQKTHNLIDSGMKIRRSKPCGAELTQCSKYFLVCIAAADRFTLI